jgi:choloylglycine hydrolase
MTNLGNYVNLRAESAPPVDLAGREVRPLGQGSGMLGMPGDFTPPSRFVRAVAFTHSALPAAGARDGVLQAFHLLNQFDIPPGAARDKEQGRVVADYTLWTAASDLRNKRFYFRTFQNSRIRMIDLQWTDFTGKSIQSLSMKGEEEFEDVTATAK